MIEIIILIVATLSLISTLVLIRLVLILNKANASYEISKFKLHKEYNQILRSLLLEILNRIKDESRK